MTRKLLLAAIGVALVAYLGACVLAGAWEERRASH
jgi:hypothetical protein